MLSLYLSLIDAEQDRKQFSDIYEKHLDWMLQIAYHYLKNEEDAKDAVHEIFYDMAKSGRLIPTEGDDKTKAYLFICIRNRVSRMVEKRNKIKTVSLSEIYNISSEYNLENEAMKNDDKSRLIYYISSLPKIYKDALSLYFVNDNTVKEIAYILKVPFKTAETRLRRGKALIKEKFGDLDI